ncbi:GGDEF domain-containing protein [Labrenzia sp. VG12]|uniref:GGDEF domain-containing protein n=1 Tax=Labrenzia sp. VG12 TaxID=2021862 RepID=UPI000B8C3BF5|nr:GGDEF domain-containing protein [Labrenzia sp. VG12]ASP33715.1 GGDEF domain-containing protein [Labrenzia sp. VG12]
MDASTLFSANVLLLSIFAITFLAISFQVSPRAHFLSWSAANALLALALLCFALDAHLPDLAAYLLPNALLLLGFGCHWHAARQIAQLPSRISNVAAPASAYLLVASTAFLLSDYALAYIASNVVFTLLAVLTISAYATAPFRGLLSPVGLILAFFFMGAEGVLRTVHGLLSGGPQGPGMLNDMTLDIHLMSALVFVSLTGAFSLALSFELIARGHKEAARRDPLTGAFNRREFQTRLEDILQGSPEEDFGLIHFDLDHFKEVNDRYGHLAGDEALVRITSAVKAQLRQNDCFARLGGEEFAVLLPSVSRDNAYKIANRLRECISGLRFEFAPEDFQLTASAGIYHGDGKALGSTDILQTVDKGLYKSKKAGRNRVSFADPAPEAS